MEWFGPSIWAFCVMFTWHTPWLWSGVLSHMVVFIFLDLFSFLFHLIFFSFFFFFFVVFAAACMVQGAYSMHFCICIVEARALWR